MESCIRKLAASIGMDCAHPLVGGFTGRGLIIDLRDIQAITQDADNPRKVLSIALMSGAKACALDNAMLTTPLEGSNVTGSNDAGFTQFTKQVNGRILMRGADVSADIVEPLVKSGTGFLVILEKRDKVGDGSFVVVGLNQPARCVDPSTVVRNENENGGAISFGLQTTENWFECTFVPTPADGQSQYSASLAAFNTMYNNDY